MRQKCWIRYDWVTDSWWLGCQVCGRVVFADWKWHWAIWAKDHHIMYHRGEE